MKITTVIFLHPTYNFYPIADDNNPKFTLPVFNKPMLAWAVEYTSPFSERIFIFCLSRHKDLVQKLIKRFYCDIEIICVDTCYRNIGTYHYGNAPQWNAYTDYHDNAYTDYRGNASRCCCSSQSDSSCNCEGSSSQCCNRRDSSSQCCEESLSMNSDTTHNFDSIDSLYSENASAAHINGFIGQSLKSIKHRIKTKVTLILRGDILILRGGFRNALSRFINSGDGMHVILRNAKNDGRIMCIDDDDRIHGYSSGCIGTEYSMRMIVSTNYDMIDFQLLKTRLLNELDHGEFSSHDASHNGSCRNHHRSDPNSDGSDKFSIKKDLIPHLIQNNVIVRAIDLDVIQLRTLEDYFRQIEINGSRNKVSVIERNTEISKKSEIKNSIIGRGVKIKSGCLIENCIIMSNSTVEDGCILQSVIVGKNTRIKEGCLIENQILGHDAEYPSIAGSDERYEEDEDNDMNSDARYSEEENGDSLSDSFNDSTSLL